MTLPVSESDLQRLIRDWLQWHGYVVLETGQYKQSQRRVNDNGTPDLFVARPGQNRWLGMEVKTPTGRLRREQAALVQQGVVVVVRSLEEAQAAVKLLN